MHKTIIISPSGNFYGSEQVLFDYLNTTNLSFQLFVPKDSFFEKKLLLQKKLWEFNRIKSFSSVKILYFKIFLELLFKPIKSVYLNEAGHIRYIFILAKVFKSVKFIVHVRLVEDASRIKKQAKNLKYFAISKYIQNQISVSSILIYDPFPFSELKKKVFNKNSIVNVGIIGRVTITKGLDKLVNLIRYIENQIEFQNFKFLLFGDINYNIENSPLLNSIINHRLVEFKGFIDSRDEIYNQIDIVLHLCETEPLGRIYLEAINYQIPLVGFMNGGIGEIGTLLGNTDLLIPYNSNWLTELSKKLELTKNAIDNSLFNFSAIKIQSEKYFSIDNYSSQMDLIIR